MHLYSKLRLLICVATLSALSGMASQNVDEVIKLSKNGSNAEVLVAFVEKSNGDFSVSADDIAALDAAGVPAVVIEAMLAKERAGSAIPAENHNAVAENETLAPAADNADISYFYESMSHDGAWTKDAEYGWSWSPTVAVGNNDWRPYVDNGSWVYTDDGWYWNSGYSWGWSAFHYGRWSHRENNWYWHPDNVWGSSWVSWRNNDGYYGWAPLTPRAIYGSGGFGLGIATGNFDLNIGLGERDYYFVHNHDFLERDLNRRQISRSETTNIYRNSTITNNYTSNNNRVSNQGLPVKSVALATKQEIKPIAIVDHPAKAGEAVHSGGVQNGRLEVFRPTLAAKASVEPTAAVARRTEAVNKRAATATNPNLARPVAVNARDTERKAEAVKHVQERAAREPRVTPTARTTPQHEPVDVKNVTTPNRVPDVKTPNERAPARVPETREPTRTEPRTRAEQPAHVEQPTRTEQPAHAQQPERNERPARTEPPARAEPARSEKSERPEKSER